MNQCSAHVIEDSVSSTGVRLITLQLAYWRAIHAEFMTHRVFSRNASSSRAIPVAKMIKQVRSRPNGPIRFEKNRPGMQSSEPLDENEQAAAQAQWERAAGEAASQAEAMMALNVHKQFANRLLEPFQTIHVVVTATEWDNFFELRRHEDAQPEIRRLADEMHAAIQRSMPTLRSVGRDNVWNWHLPYVRPDEREKLAKEPDLAARISAARCARVSYMRQDGAAPSLKDDLGLFDRLVGSRPLHASPTEHQAYPIYNGDTWVKNFRGWHQFRADVEWGAKQASGKEAAASMVA